jgi:hypothetical protein
MSASGVGRPYFNPASLVFASHNLQIKFSQIRVNIETSQPASRDDNMNVTPFTVHISDDSLAQLDTLLRLTPIADPTYGTSLPDGSRKFGMRYDWLTKAVEEWRSTFDW